MKLTPCKSYFIRPCPAFPGSTGIFYFKSVRAAKCYITQHLVPKP